ncbi:MAG: hypothetical protein J6A73_08480 [Lachnospiraceae bacterium]|nr:hypothetical protein [Lachnospiraceae bacterium]
MIMTKEECQSKVNCCFCPHAVLVAPSGFKSFKEIAGIVGVWEALSIAEVECPYMNVLHDLVNDYSIVIRK